MFELKPFEYYIHHLCLELNTPIPEIIERQCLLFFPGCALHIALDGRGEHATYASPVYFTGGDASLIHRDIIADYNARRLFKGGERLAVDPATGAIYLTQSVLFTNARRRGADHVRQFLQNCSNCTLWYADAIFDSELRVIEDHVFGASRTQIDGLFVSA